MKEFTGFQWLLIDAANQQGYDKWLFEERIQWAEANLPVLETFIETAETKPLYIKAVSAIRKAQAGIPTGHLVGVDASCSGIQLLSVLSGCAIGSENTGLIDPNKRADAYTATTAIMGEILGNPLVVARKDAKEALMTSYYGSTKVPKRIFGEDTPELDAFYGAARRVAPGAWELLQTLLAAWQAGALVHSWKLPDGFDARIKVMTKIETRIEVDELDHASFTYEYYVNEGEERGISLPANVTHSVDAFVLREMHRRCNYDDLTTYRANEIIKGELYAREHHAAVQLVDIDHCEAKLAYYLYQYERSGAVSAVILPYLTAAGAQLLSTTHLEALSRITDMMLSYLPFELVTIHDEFRSHANNVNHVRRQYREILAEIAESHLIDDILSQIHGKQGRFPKLSTGLGNKIRQSEYALT